jgi:endo-1,4-beta-xylanase
VGGGGATGGSSEGGSTAGGGGLAAGGLGGFGGVAGSASGGGGTTGGGGGTTGGAGGSAGGTSAHCANPTKLWHAGTCTNRLIGVALTNRNLDEAQYADLALEFNYVTPEDEMKWDATEQSQNSFDFTEGDKIVEFAEANGMKVKGHTLVWHNQLPTWLTNLSGNALHSAMINHIQKVMAHYKGRVIAWDVVNEAWGDDGQIRDSLWSDNFGATFIEDAFKAARAADPDVKLYYNDYDIESDYPKADAVYEMVKDFKERGVPIDGVGMQMHTRTTDEDPPIPEFEANLKRLLALGVEVLLSEMDVRYCAGGTDEQQKKRFHDIIAVCMENPGCTDLTVWGITDKYSFLNSRTDLQCQGNDPPRPLLWNDNYVKKPSYDGVMDALLGK